MKNATIFTAAHKLASTFEGQYSACFALALRTVRTTAAEGVTVADVFSYIRDVRVDKNRYDSTEMRTLQYEIKDHLTTQVINFLPTGTLAYKIATTTNYEFITEKQIWVIAYELVKCAPFTYIVFDMVTRDRVEAENKAAAKKANADQVLAEIKASRKIAAFTRWIKTSQFKKEFWSGKYTEQSVAAFLAL
jgi:putative component of membrane protein insertase Oxa1/YidC/SpoIIIJ protein YidD